MIRYEKSTLAKYLGSLAAREPVPGGGSAAALSGALGAALIEMVAQYSLGKGKPAVVEKKLSALLKTAGVARSRLTALVSRDAAAYLALKAAKKAGARAYQAAAKEAAAVPREVASQCAALLKLTSFLRQEGNIYLLSDVIAAEAFLKAAGTAAQAMIEANS